MEYRELKFPIGIFRQYPDKPNVWIQVEGKPLPEIIKDNFEKQVNK